MLARDSSLHVRKLRQVGLAQHQADVGIGDEESRTVDDVSLPLLSDLDARHDVPDELQVDVGEDHGPLVAARAQSDGHVRLGLLAEVHRPEPRLSAFRVAESRLLRAILARTDVVHAEPRDRDLFVAACIDLRDVGDFRCLAQELQELDAPQLDIARIELGQRGVPELLLDPGDVLLDARRRGERLLVLQACQRQLVLLVREIDADRARCQQRDRHQREDEEEVLAEQPAAADAARGGAGGLRLREEEGGHAGLLYHLIGT